MCMIDLPTRECCTHCEYRLKHDKVEMQLDCLGLLHVLKKLMMVVHFAGLGFRKP